jgi:hypothetical protein
MLPSRELFRLYLTHLDARVAAAAARTEYSGGARLVSSRVGWLERSLGSGLAESPRPLSSPPQQS